MNIIEMHDGVILLITIAQLYIVSGAGFGLLYCCLVYC